MPFFVNTPECLLDRSDSKDPSTTCRGITASGRPCRRPVARPVGTASPVARFGAAQLRVDDPRDAALYCWQHKDQAALSAHSSPGARISSTPILEQRTSLDTLADRLGLVAQKKKSERKHPGRQRQKQQKQQPEAEKPGRPPHGEKQQHRQRPAKAARPKPAPATKTVGLFCCCFRIPVEEVPRLPPPPRPKPRPLQSPASAALPPRVSAHKRSGDSSSRSSSSAVSETARYLSLMPENAPPRTASLLMAELAKPVSPLDEPGYIYVFWLTLESRAAAQQPPPVAAARSLLSAPAEGETPTRPGRGGARRPSDVIAAFAAASSSSSSTGRDSGGGGVSSGRARNTTTATNKILLKIGRATNVQRRLNEWTRQCGHDLSLVRYYPYIPSAAVAAAVPRKLPHSHRVERLIHLELAGLGLRVADRDRCGACGREHREWFEVEATRKGVADVDRVIRKWADWDEALG